jgi:hypothetical protein
LPPRRQRLFDPAPQPEAVGIVVLPIGDPARAASVEDVYGHTDPLLSRIEHRVDPAGGTKIAPASICLTCIARLIVASFWQKCKMNCDDSQVKLRRLRGVSVPKKALSRDMAS